MIRASVSRSSRKGKKWHATVTFPDGEKANIHFGGEGNKDFTQHHDKAKREAYIARHGSSGEDWQDPRKAGFWSRWLLWERESLEDAARAIQTAHGIEVHLNDGDDGS